MTQVIQLRRDTAPNWASANPILADGEMGIVRDNLTYKIGDGTTPWNSLPARTLSGVFGTALTLAGVSNPNIPNANNLHMYAHNVGGRMMAKWMGPSGIDTPIQPAMFSNGMVMVSPGGSTAFSVLGTSAPTAVGTVSHPSITVGGNLRSTMRRGIVTSAATPGAASELRIAVPLTYRGEDIAPVKAGGFFFTTRFAVSTNLPDQRVAVGLWNSTSATSVTLEPNALTNCIFLGYGTTDNNMQIMSNDGTGTCGKIDLGPDFPAREPNAVYELILFAAPNTDTVSYRVMRLDTNKSAEGVINNIADLPAKATTLTWHAYANNGASSATVVLEVMRMYLETDY
jgi:hypothetical protein